MSDQINFCNSPIKREVIDQIQKLDLSTIQKLHLKLLAHCLEVFKEIAVEPDTIFPCETLLKEWCEKEAKTFKDEKFSKLLFQQMNSAAEKIKAYANRTGKAPLKLKLDDLIELISLDN
tara:strand:+ start:886 stop:1242 length:357 start_codon:yes stop_codon:yes gene_type:complete